MGANLEDNFEFSWLCFLLSDLSLEELLHETGRQKRGVPMTQRRILALKEYFSDGYLPGANVGHSLAERSLENEA